MFAVSTELKQLQKEGLKTITNSQYDQLPVGLIAQLVEHCTGIAEVMGSNPVQALIFSTPSFRNCLSCVLTARIFLLFNLSSTVQYMMFHIFIFKKMSSVQLTKLSIRVVCKTILVVYVVRIGSFFLEYSDILSCDF